jgi:hypothetical protein
MNGNSAEDCFSECGWDAAMHQKFSSIFVVVVIDCRRPVGQRLERFSVSKKYN